MLGQQIARPCRRLQLSAASPDSQTASDTLRDGCNRLGHRLRVVCGRLHLGAVAAVLGAGADVAAADRRGRTAVHALAAAQCSSAAAPTAAAILRLLLRRGAQVRPLGSWLGLN